MQKIVRERPAACGFTMSQHRSINWANDKEYYEPRLRLIEKAGAGHRGGGDGEESGRRGTGMMTMMKMTTRRRR